MIVANLPDVHRDSSLTNCFVRLDFHQFLNTGIRLLKCSSECAPPPPPPLSFLQGDKEWLDCRRGGGYMQLLYGATQFPPHICHMAAAARLLGR
jgi:hypothetical protein